MAKICAVMNRKGGCLKSTVSVITTLLLRDKGYKVLIVDGDDQGNTSMFFGADMNEGTATLADIFYGDVPAIECVQHTEMADIIPTDAELVDAETKISFDERRFSHLRESLESVRDNYDVILFDTPPALNVINKNILACPDLSIVIPILESGWSLSGLMDLYNAIARARQYTNPDINILGILTVMAKKNTNSSKRINEEASSLCEKMGTTMFDVSIRDSVKIKEALTEYWVSPLEYAPDCNPMLDYKEYIEEFIERMGLPR